MKQRNGYRTKDYFIKAYCPRRKTWFTWAGFTMKRLKRLADAEGLIKLKKYTTKLNQN